MAMPRTVRITRDGVEFISNIDRTQYTLKQLQMAALREVGKLIRKRVMQQAKSQVGMKRSKRIMKSFQYWARKREVDLQVGIKHNTWYGIEQELGTRGQRRKAILMNAVFENIDDIRRIMGVYISSIEDMNRAEGLISEDANEQGGDDDE
ncbi:hypothetical protein GC096_03830 [Paenibacillus sp. LMG 31461]|uniref:Phage protein n=1 Tax=Paenibacillus plantarum TaxID=2654975 RepID=A0ABX1X449_9BACL|nr:HK97-gp10 family putative phage morphogenesis protein [Paenibacillus plantarum]NOU63176.1 hypothetical protein [Paenibacillus plantarum]